VRVELKFYRNVAGDSDADGEEHGQTGASPRKGLSFGWGKRERLRRGIIYVGMRICDYPKMKNGLIKLITSIMYR